MQVDDVLAEPEKELVGGLTADATAYDLVVGEKLGACAWPAVGDAVAHEHHAVLSLGGQPYCLVVLGIAVPVGKLVFLCLHTQAGQQKNLQ